MELILITDPATGSKAIVAPELGFNCFRFEAKLPHNRNVSVLSAVDGFEHGGHRASHSGIPVLFPYPNRIARGQFSWNGKSYKLPEGLVAWDKTGNAIHGFCLDRPWRVTERNPSAVTGTFRLSIDAPDRLACWPTDAEISVRYSISGSCLRCEIRVLNPTDVPLPWGFGTHSYFQIPLSSESQASQCRVFAPTSRVWDLDECLPTGSQSNATPATRLKDSPKLDGLKLDDVYTQLAADGDRIVTSIEDPAAGVVVEQRFCRDFRELVAFTPSWSSSVCLEPYTCLTNAINLQQQGVDAGLQILPPRCEWNGWIEIEAMSLRR